MCRSVIQTGQAAKRPGGFFGLGVSILKDHVGCSWQPAAAWWYHLEGEFLEEAWRLRPDCFCFRRTWAAVGCQRSYYGALPPSLRLSFSSKLAIFWSQENISFDQPAKQPLLSDSSFQIHYDTDHFHFLLKRWLQWKQSCILINKLTWIPVPSFP